MNVRKADLNDASAICRICTDDLGYECSKEFVSNCLKSIDESRELVFAAEIGGAAVGYIHAELYNTLYFASIINILGLAVSRSHRRRGIDRALIACAEK